MSPRLSSPETPPSPRQAEVYRWLFERTMADGFQPSYDEACAHFGWKVRHAVVCHIVGLRKKGWLGAGTNQSRALRFLKTPDGGPFAGFTTRVEDTDGQA